MVSCIGHVEEVTADRNGELRGVIEDLYTSDYRHRRTTEGARSGVVVGCEHGPVTPTEDEGIRRYEVWPSHLDVTDQFLCSVRREPHTTSWDLPLHEEDGSVIRDGRPPRLEA